MHKPKVMAFDLDGTLADSKQPLSPAMAKLLGTLLHEMPVAVMSGASFTQFKKQFLSSLQKEANLENLYIFPDNAAQCFLYRQGDWRSQYDHAFTPVEKEAIMYALNTALQEVGLAEDPKEVWGERIEDRQAQISFSPLGQLAPLHAKEEWHSEHKSLRKKLETILIGLLPDFSVAEGGLTTIDITRKGITKAFGIEQLSELTAVPISEMLYVGDALDTGGNDFVVIKTNVPTHTVLGPQETATLIESIVHKDQ